MGITNIQSLAGVYIIFFSLIGVKVTDKRLHCDEIKFYFFFIKI